MVKPKHADTPVLDRRKGKAPFQWKLSEVGKYYIYVAVLIYLILETPNRIWDGTLGMLTYTLGILGIWRYTWWMTHFVRAQIYERFRYPSIRDKAAQIWDKGWRPKRVYFMITSYMEHPETCEKVVLSICRELKDSGVPGTIIVGTGVPQDEDTFTAAVEHVAGDVDLDVVYVRQTGPGKRIAIGLALRALCRRGAYGDDPVFFMDGDSILAPGCLRKCLPILAVRPDVHALTTYETVIAYGPRWMQRWLDIRFAQRHMVMQSHALSWKVLTLTGRMSLYRASKVVETEFIETVENDNLDHWLWGRFRFLSGDDKSTWFSLVKARARMLYIPDAQVYTVERIGDKPFERAVQNVFRWSGNLLRNGARVIALGPRRVGLFIWWCVVDQRLAMWTAIAGIVSMITAGIFIDPLALWAFLVWVMVTRLFFSTILFYYARRIDMTFPFLLYANQLGLAFVKIYIVFRLPFQRWTNRGNQSVYGQGGIRWWIKRSMAAYITLIWLLGFLILLFTYSGIIPMPDYHSFTRIFGG